MKALDFLNLYQQKRQLIKPLTLFACFFAAVFTARAEQHQYVEFDPIFLRSFSAADIDVSRFSYGNPIAVGEYVADIYLNEQAKGRLRVKFAEMPAENRTALCADSALLSLLDLKADALSEADLRQNGENTAQCLFFSQRVPEAKVDFDLSVLRLNITLPQAFIQPRPLGYISPSQWQDGVPAAFVRYDISQYQSNYADKTYQQRYLGIDAGINLFGWALRHRGSKSWQDDINSPYQPLMTYLQHDVAALRGQLTIGDFFTGGVLVDNIGLRGVQLVSDDRMLPSVLRGFAPIVRGVANGNARVIIRQNGNILRELSVPAGPFEINDLYPTGFGGDIEVEIKEADGESHRFSVPYTTTAQLIRPGFSRYQLAIGRYRYGDTLYSNYVAQGTWQYGINNRLTLNLGATLAKNYQAPLFGVSFNTPLGSVAANATFSQATFKNSDIIRKGYSLYLGYNTRINPTETDITLAAYRYSSKGYYNLHEVMYANHSDFLNDYDLDMGVFSDYRQKMQFQISLNQRLSPNIGYLYISGSTHTYWNSRQKQHSYQIGYSNYFRRLNYSLNFSQSLNGYGYREKRFYANFSLPLGQEKPTYLSQSLSFDRGHIGSTTAVSGSLGKAQRYSYNLSFNRSQDGSHQYAINQSYSSPMAQLALGLSRDNRHNRQLSYGISGAIVAHPKGVTLSNDLGDTFAIIHAKGAKGAKINGTIGNELDYFGNGILPYIEPYNLNYVNIDINDISNDVALEATEQQVIPRANTAILINFATTVGRTVFFQLTDNNKLPPIGTEVFDQDGKVVGMMAQGGRLYTQGVAEKGKLSLTWGEEYCVIPYQLPDSEQSPLFVNVQCRFERQ